MRITESQLRKIVRQEIFREAFNEPDEEYDRAKYDPYYPKLKVIGKDYRLPNGEPVIDLENRGIYPLFNSPEAAWDSVYYGQGKPTKVAVYRDTKTGEYFARARYRDDYQSLADLATKRS